VRHDKDESRACLAKYRRDARNNRLFYIFAAKNHFKISLSPMVGADALPVNAGSIALCLCTSRKKLPARTKNRIDSLPPYFGFQSVLAKSPGPISSKGCLSKYILLIFK